ncbi:hypothetical protein [Prosthecobacter fluviatilis]|uniref:Uncharacterized protein n=1 Tax=Prosthecobacter fluviatilis TaxID=445931 RepID=A0ABW0KJT2_9BACT
MAEINSSNVHFPEAVLLRLFGQVSLWTTIKAIRSAAKVLSQSGEAQRGALVLTFDNNDKTQMFLTKILEYFIKTYQCPREQLCLAKQIDPNITPEVAEKIAEMRFKPDVSVGGADYVAIAIPWVPQKNVRALVIHDHPAMIELIYEPIQMLHNAALGSWEQASRYYDLLGDRRDSETNELQDFHRHYGDGAFRATLDALAYYCFGFRIGLRLSEGRADLDMAFRAVNIIGTPPFPKPLIKIGKELYDKLSAELTNK